MKDSLLLLKNFIKKPKEVGAIAPSSKFLTKEIIKNSNLEDSDIIVELGPGLGTFTREILRNSNDDAKLICIEVNKKFCNYLRNNIYDERLKLINSKAEKINHELKEEKADCIISGLPFRNFSDRQKNTILKEVKKALNENGRFVLFQYTNGLVDLLRSHFSRVERKFVALNVPPAFVYVCWK